MKKEKKVGESRQALGSVPLDGGWAQWTQMGVELIKTSWVGGGGWESRRLVGKTKQNVFSSLFKTATFNIDFLIAVHMLYFTGSLIPLQKAIKFHCVCFSIALFLTICHLGSYAVLQVLIAVLCLKDPQCTLFRYLNGPPPSILSLNREAWIFCPYS